MVGEKRLELLRLATLDLKSSTSTRFTSWDPASRCSVSFAPVFCQESLAKDRSASERFSLAQKAALINYYCVFSC